MSFPRDQHDCYRATDPRINDDLHHGLKGKVAVVFGAGRGVGRACAQFLASSSAKAIICLALEKQEVVQTAEFCRQASENVETRAYAVDVQDSSAVEQIVRDIEREFGHIDVLVMNAGRPGQWLTTAESDPGVWWETVAVSLQGAFNCSHAVLRVMQRQKSGRIIFTSSIGAHSNKLMGGYVVGKLGQVRLAEIIHAENFKEYNIKCFAYNPGVVKTRFFTDFEEKAVGKPMQEGSYASRDDEMDLKSARFAYNALKDETFDAPEMAAGLVTALAAGALDFMSGRYLDAAVNIQHYIDHRKEIVEKDLCRVRLNLGWGELTPSLDY